MTQFSNTGTRCTKGAEKAAQVDIVGSECECFICAKRGELSRAIIVESRKTYLGMLQDAAGEKSAPIHVIWSQDEGF